MSIFARTILSASVIFLGACTYAIKSEPTADSDGVEQFYEYPQGRSYNRLGQFAWGFYRPGWSAPALSDVWPDLAQKVKEVGGNACVVRKQDNSGYTNRNIIVTCEVLVMRDQTH